MTSVAMPCPNDRRRHAVRAFNVARVSGPCPNDRRRHTVRAFSKRRSSLGTLSE